MRRYIVTPKTVGLAAFFVVAAAVPAAAMSLLVVREAAAPSVCLVTVQNAVGVPLAHAAGFLLGEGRFAVTDLASLAQPGADRAVLRFADGSTATARRFAIADPFLGLAAIRLEEPRAGGGLTLASAPPPEAAEEVAVAGWRWTREPDLVVGRLARKITSADLAARLKLEPPTADRTFMDFRGTPPDIASGAPVLDASGQVVGILLHLAGSPQPVVVPAAVWREGLLASEPKLKPLSELPKSFWPAAVVPFAAKPVTATEFAQALRTIKLRSRCSRCGGAGTILVSKIVGTTKRYGMDRPVVRQEQVACPECRGEKVVFDNAFYDQYVAMAADGAWLAAAAGVDPKGRDAALAGGMNLLKSLSGIGSRYREALSRRTQEDLADPNGAWPRGLAVFAQIRDTLDGPDGSYVLLAPYLSEVTLTVRTDRLKAASGSRDGSMPEYGDWLVLAGMGLGPVEPAYRSGRLQGAQPICLQPFVWAPGPDLGPPPKRESAEEPQRPRRPSTQSPAKEDNGANFFGL